jgi:hypothetical protein
MYAHADNESKRGLKKSAAVKKNMAFLQRLTTHQEAMTSTVPSAVQSEFLEDDSGLVSADNQHFVSSEGEGMIEAALALAKSKVVVKRAPGAEWLGGRKPASSITGKATRFDIYPVS